MRDLIVTAVVAALLLATLRHPVVGAYAWAWLSMMNPQKLAYGFALGIPYAQIVAITTMVMFVASRQRHAYPVTPLSAVHIVFLLWMCFTSFFALNDPDVIKERVFFVAKIQIMLMVTMMLIRGRRQIEILIWVVTFSVAFYGIKGGVYTVATGGSGRVWGPPGSMIEGNNELAVALTMLVPMMYYLYQVNTHRWVRLLLIFSMVTCTFSILGSQSRGALLALVAMGLVLGLKGKHPVRSTLLLVSFGLVAIAFMPDSWSNRMDTIQTYQADGSAMSRIWTWTTLWNAALDRPFVGVGFATDSGIVFETYSPRGPEWDVFAGHRYVAHSIYFQALGEHGFPGLAIYLLLGLVMWRTAGRLARQTRDDPEFGSWVPLLMPMVQVSLIGFAVGGAFLTLVHFDVTYYFFAIIVLTDVTFKKRLAERAEEAARAARRVSATLPPRTPLASGSQS